MLTKITFITLILFSLSFSQSTITLASFNIRIFSDNSRNDTELKQICLQLKDYDFIAIQELRDERIMERAVEMLDDEFNKEYSFVISDAVGTERHKERYAFLYRSDLIDYLDFSDSYPDVADNFIREPFYASFISGNFDFTIITIHSIYGHSKAERRAEARLLDEVYSYVQQENGVEQDVILCGDFNLSASDDAFNDLRNIYSMQELISGGTSIKDKEYDNIWINPTYTSEYNNSAGIDKFDETDFQNEDAKASLAVSDHRPIWAKYVTSNPDDDGITIDNAPSGTLVNVNTASLEELKSLPGIGDVIASRIITERQTQAFQNIQDLQDRVSGIGPVLAGRLSSLVTFN
jgi:competence ComEA-like helix-hairpin-helix protein